MIKEEGLFVMNTDKLIVLKAAKNKTKGIICRHTNLTASFYKLGLEENRKILWKVRYFFGLWLTWVQSWT